MGDLYDLWNAARAGYIERITHLLSTDKRFVNAQDSYDYTAFMLAALHGHADCMRLIHSTGDVDINMRNKDGSTALMLAAYCNQVECMNIIRDIGGAAVNVFDNYGHTALMLAAKYGYVECLNVIRDIGGADVNVQNCHGDTALMLAAENGHFDCMNIIRNIADVVVNVYNKHRSTALMLAAENGHVECMNVIYNIGGADVNVLDIYRNTALMLAAREGYVECVNVIRDIGGADINVRNDHGNTALMLAATHGHAECMNIICDIGDADVNVCDDCGNTAFMLAAKNGHLKCMSIIQNITGLDINALNDCGNSAFMLAAKNGHVDCMKLIHDIDYVDVNVQNKYGNTAFMLAARHGHVDCMNGILDIGGVDVNVQNHEAGRTALMLAAVGGHSECIQCLVGMEDIDFNLQDAKGSSAVLLAAVAGNTECCERLCSFIESCIPSGYRQEGITSESWYGRSLRGALNNYRDSIECPQFWFNASFGAHSVLARIENNKNSICFNMTHESVRRVADTGVGIYFDGINDCLINLLKQEAVNVHSCVQVTEGSVFKHVARFDRRDFLHYFMKVLLKEQSCITTEHDQKQSIKSTFAYMPFDMKETPNNVGNSVTMLGVRNSGITCYFKYESGISWKPPYVYNHHQGESSTLCCLVRGGLARCIICFLLGELDSHLDESGECPHDGLAGSEIHAFDKDGNTSLMDIARWGSASTLDYLLQYERIRFHALVLLFREHLMENNEISLLLYKKLTSLIQNVADVDLFLQMICGNYLIGECVNFALSAFICHSNQYNESALKSCLLNGRSECRDLLLEHITSSHHLVSNKTKEIFLEACRDYSESKNGFTFLRALLHAGVFDWSWYPEWAVENLGFLTRELVINHYPPEEFEFQGQMRTPLEHAFLISNNSLVRYLVANLYLTSCDVKSFQSNREVRDHVLESNNEDLRALHRQLVGSPWRLEALSLLTVSAQLKSKDRCKDVQLLQETFPSYFEARLAFGNLISRLCVEEWPNIDQNYLLRREVLVTVPSKQMKQGSCCNGDCWTYR